MLILDIMKKESLTDQIKKDKKLFEYKLPPIDLDSDDDDGFLMASFGKDTTGLPMIIFVCQRGNYTHNPQLKISMSHDHVTDDLAVIEISPKVRIISGYLSNEDFKLINKWIELNKEILISYWNMQFSSAALCKVLKPLKNNISESNNEEQNLFEMVNLRPKDTGLPMTIWVGPKAGAKHDIRIKVCMNHGDTMNLDNLAIVAIRPKPHVIVGMLSKNDEKLVFEWINLNLALLIAYWNYQLLTPQMHDKIIPIPRRKLK